MLHAIWNLKFDRMVVANVIFMQPVAVQVLCMHLPLLQAAVSKDAPHIRNDAPHHATDVHWPTASILSFNQPNVLHERPTVEVFSFISVDKVGRNASRCKLSCLAG